ncbi:MAG: thiamine diphosphokinase [Lachnospiraceae bacterium]|nr:thiamine diphosphokinase [Lachnospiraceae bacterium]
MESGICYIFGAGEKTDCNITLTSDDIVIAADGGYDYLEELGLRADFVLGDFDSVLSYDLPSDSLRYPAEKDDTDLMLAAKLGLKKGYTEFAIYGGLGGRLDHTIGNIQLLTYLSRNDATGTLYGDNYAIRVITDGTISFGKDLPENTPGNLCSVFSLSDISVNVTIQGLKYELADINLTNSFPLGISNEFTGKKAYVNVKKGTIVVLWYLSNT